MEIRTADFNDAKSIAHLNGYVHSIHAKEHPDLFLWPANLGEVADSMIELMTPPNNRFFLAEQEKIPVGYIYCQINRRPKDALQPEREFIYIHHIVVCPEARNQGIGKALMNHVIEMAREEKIERVMLDVWWFNHDARQFFTDVGFTVFNERIWTYVRE